MRRHHLISKINFIEDQPHDQTIRQFHENSFQEFAICSETPPRFASTSNCQPVMAHYVDHTVNENNHIYELDHLNRVILVMNK